MSSHERRPSFAWVQKLRPYFEDLRGKVLRTDVYVMLGFADEPEIAVAACITDTMRELGFRPHRHFYQKGYIGSRQADEPIYVFQDPLTGEFAATKENIPPWAKMTLKERPRRVTIHAIPAPPRNLRGPQRAAWREAQGRPLSYPDNRRRLG